MLKPIHIKKGNNNYDNYNDILMPTLSDNNILFIIGGASVLSPDALSPQAL